MKKCKLCQQEKEESGFYKRKRVCKRCVELKRKEKWKNMSEEDKAKKRRQQKEYLEKNKEAVKERKKRYREKNREKLNAQVMDLYRKNKDKYEVKRKEWRENNKNDQKAKKRKDREDNPEKYRQIYQKNRDKKLAHRKKWGEKNKDKIKHYKRESYFRTKLSQPQKYILRSIRSVISRLGKGQKRSKSLEYIGVSDHFEFVSLMSRKTDCLDWYLNREYHIDHIWQVNWCDDLLSSEVLDERIEEILHCLNHHSNLRPLLGLENLTRSHYDFSLLSKDDYPKFEPFLDERIKIGLKFFWENLHLFSGEVIKKGSNEELLIQSHIRSCGVEP
jgi:hypothetical protein